MIRLARALVPRAHRALSLAPARNPEDGPLLDHALEAIDGFLAYPVASRYLLAVRALDTLARLRRRSDEIERLSRRAIDAELDRLERLDLMPGENAIAQLRALPPDPRAGRRLQALAALLDAHRAITLRVRAPEQLRARLGLPKTAGSARKGDRRTAARPARRRA